MSAPSVGAPSSNFLFCQDCRARHHPRPLDTVGTASCIHSLKPTCYAAKTSSRKTVSLVISICSAKIGLANSIRTRAISVGPASCIGKIVGHANKISPHDPAKHVNCSVPVGSPRVWTSPLVLPPPFFSAPKLLVLHLQLVPPAPATSVGAPNVICSAKFRHDCPPSSAFLTHTFVRIDVYVLACSCMNVHTHVCVRMPCERVRIHTCLYARTVCCVCAHSCMSA